MLNFFLLQILLLFIRTRHVYALDLIYSDNYTQYSIVHQNQTLFASTQGIAIYLDGAWHVSGVNLSLVNEKVIKSLEEAYTGNELHWQTNNNVSFITTTRVYNNNLGISFAWALPDGAIMTSIVEHENITHEAVMSNFPAFDIVNLPNSISWSGTFLQPTWGYSTGPVGGPTVFFNSSDSMLNTVIIASANNHFKASSSGTGFTWNNIPAWAPGISGRITSLPTAFTHEWVLHVGATRGITAAMAEWGLHMQTSHHSHKVPDLTLTHIGYQTDNGAAYVFPNACDDPGNCSKTLLDVVESLEEVKVPIAYLSFQGITLFLFFKCYYTYI